MNQVQPTSDHALDRENNLLSAHPPFLTLAIQLIRDLLRNADSNVSFVGAEAQQGERACQRAYQQPFRSCQGVHRQLSTYRVPR